MKGEVGHDPHPQQALPVYHTKTNLARVEPLEPKPSQNDSNGKHKNTL
jgi:hypothetical protein